MKNNPVYGWEPEEVDPHMLTNLEWGAVAYLSKSISGADTEEIWNNAFYKYRTGCSGTEVDAASEKTCVEYNTLNGQKASTTHNIYGVYDMSGGSWDRVMGNYNNLPTTNTSGFTEETLLNINSKYINRYFTKTEDLLGGVGMAYDTNIYGDAVYETSYDAARHNGSSWEGTTAGSWYGDASYLPQASGPWFYRGGDSGNNTNAGLFNFSNSRGCADIYYSFRPGLRLAS
ncbi:MAG: hypothetical protein PHG03_01750 [Bacilli bacterium]|nr:hypothetical protein [Bacilli bacterium]